MVQRASLFLFAFSGALLLTYALGYLTNAYIFYAFGDNRLHDFYHEMQRINTGLLLKSLLVIVFALALFALQLNRHAAGFYTLVIAMIVCAASVFMAADSVVKILAIRHEYVLLDLSVLNRYIERGSISYRSSTMVFDFGIAGYALFFASSVFVAASVARNAFAVNDSGEPIISAATAGIGEKS